MDISLSKDQQFALKILLEWFKDINKNQFITLGGYAGTGKTTLISLFRQELAKEHKNISVSFCSYTGKATRVLENKLKSPREGTADLLHQRGRGYAQDTVSTIHGLIYSAVTNNREEIIGWERKPKIGSDLIIVDEASMVDQYIWNDLMSYGLPIIAVGDHGQLPPIRGSFNLMEKPLLKLEEIHRQAADNPIIHLSIDARTKGHIEPGHYGANIMKVSRSDDDSKDTFMELLENYNTDTLVLCGYNHTRVKLNKHIRTVLEFESSEPEPGDRVICLRNNHEKHIYNGMLGTIQKIFEHDDSWWYAEIQSDGALEGPTQTSRLPDTDVFKGLIAKQQFNATEGINFTEKRGKFMKGDLFDFGYATTVHKAQGSQAKRVILFEERFKQMDDDMWRRWLYTAVTRAEEELFILGT